MKVAATIATLLAYSTAEFHEARVCAQQLKIKLGEKVTFDSACLSPHSAGLGCVGDAPGCRYCEFGEYASVPCIPGNSFPPIRTYSGEGLQNNFQSQFPALAQTLSRFPGLAQTLSQYSQQRQQQPMRGALMEKVMDMSEPVLLNKYNDYVNTFTNIPTDQAKPLTFHEWKAQLMQQQPVRGALRGAFSSQANPLRAALVERVRNLKQHNPIRAALMERYQNVKQTAFPIRQALTEMSEGAQLNQYNDYVNTFNNIPTEQAKPLVFDAWKATQLQQRPVMNFIQSRMMSVNDNEDALAAEYETYVRGFETISTEQATPKTFPLWKQEKMMRMPLMSEESGEVVAAEYESYVRGFENIPSEQGSPLPFDAWKNQQHSHGHRRLTGYGGYGRGGYGGYGRGGYGRGFGFGGYGRGGFGRGGYGRWGRGRYWG